MPDDYLVDLKDDEEKFKFIGGPIEQPDQCGNLFHLIGHFAASWARMEQHIDAILIQVNKKDHSDEIDDLYDPRHPGTFDQKIKLLKRYFQRHPMLSGHINSVNVLAKGLKDLSSDRNNMLHGIVEDYRAGADPIFVLHAAKSIPKKRSFMFRRSEYPLERLQQVTDQVNLAHYACAKFQGNYSHSMPSHNFKRQGSQFVVGGVVSGSLARLNSAPSGSRTRMVDQRAT